MIEHRPGGPIASSGQGPRPKVCFATLQGISARVFLLPLMEELNRRGYAMHLITGRESSEEPDHLDRISYLTTHRVYMPRGIAPLRDVFAVLRLRRHLRAAGYGLVHPHMSKCASLVLPAARWAGVPVRLYTNHGMAFLSAQGIRRRLLRRVEARSCSLADRVYFVSESNRTAALEAGVVRGDRSAVIGAGSICGLDADRFAATPDRIRAGRSWRQRLGIAPAAFVVGYVGRPVAHKGFGLTLRAWARHFGSESAVHLLLVGAAPPKVAEGFGGQVPPNVSAVAWSDMMAELYAAMDVVLLPSLHEGLGYTLLEAGAAGRAVIGSRIPGVVDAIEADVTGLLVDPGCPEAIAAAVHRLWRDPTLRERLGRAGERRVRERFDRQTVCRAFGDEIDRMVGRPGGALR